MKDNFSSHSDKYSKFRPTYPSDFFDYLNAMISNKQNAWDCGTGNGQVAYELAKIFEAVDATDISQAQIANAMLADNIKYSVQPAEKTDFEDNHFDLVVAAQAIHWFDFDKFYAEVRRTARPSAMICVVGYGRIKISEQIDELITHFYKEVIGRYWDKERLYIDENYETIPFPFEKVSVLKFENKHEWTLAHLIGYLNTWSAVKHFVHQNGYNPVTSLASEIEKNWGNHEDMQVTFPLLLRIGKVGD